MFSQPCSNSQVNYSYSDYTGQRMPNSMMQMVNMPQQQNQYYNPVTQQSQYQMRGWDTMSCFSSNSGSSQLTSMYIQNQKKRSLTDEIINCLNTSLENLLPEIAQQTAEAIYKIILPYIEKQDKEIKELQSHIDILENTFRQISCFIKNKNPIDNLNNISGQLIGINSSIENCNASLENKIQMEKGSIENKNKQNEKLIVLKNKMEALKDALILERDKIKETNNNLSNAFNDIGKLKQGIDDRVTNLNMNLKYGQQLYDNDNKNIQNLNKIEEIINKFYDNINSSKCDNINTKNNNNNSNNEQKIRDEFYNMDINNNNVKDYSMIIEEMNINNPNINNNNKEQHGKFSDMFLKENFIF